MPVRRLAWNLAAAALLAASASSAEVACAVGDYSPGGFKPISAGVDAVLHEKAERYQRYANTGKP